MNRSNCASSWAASRRWRKSSIRRHVKAQTLNVCAFLLSEIDGVGASHAASATTPSAELSATLSYFYINAFRFVDAHVASRAVRYAMQAHEPEAYLDPNAAKAVGADYLRAELATRLKHGQIKFDYVVQIAEPSDATNDPTAYWQRPVSFASNA
jgi:hypothetical protein